ncbi:hypothetical protein GN330_10380 [Nitratireductor sp. CAU 1489]|uniref:Uncharacterized protein n=1 Tax=Nitratireductor arenosus TaxID=2682096 RepID=A0A844QI81_9HYPH|nr:hypothetical protein [Nitratireductor arenosus]MVA97651.1 hypothetical protein [Nitratireductor arenosus]
MAIRSLIAAFAIGLCLCASGQAQEQSDSSQRQEDAEQAPADNLYAPFRVEIVEDQAEADTRQRREAESRKREEDDLIAQQGMNSATELMANYAWWQTVATWVGAILVAGTLVLMIYANKSAVQAANAAMQGVKDARRIGQAQVAAYLAIEGGEFTLTEQSFHGWVNVKNHG